MTILWPLCLLYPQTFSRVYFNSFQASCETHLKSEVYIDNSLETFQSWLSFYGSSQTLTFPVKWVKHWICVLQLSTWMVKVTTSGDFEFGEWNLWSGHVWSVWLLHKHFLSEPQKTMLGFCMEGKDFIHSLIGIDSTNKLTYLLLLGTFFLMFLVSYVSPGGWDFQSHEVWLSSWKVLENPKQLSQVSGLVV